MNVPAVPKNARFAFTLIELLVVVAIIAVLAGLLVPVVSKGKLKSGAAKCLHNLKNLQQANVLYANDNNGEYIGAWSNNDKGSPMCWFDRAEIRKHVGAPAAGLPAPRSNWPTATICPQATAALKNNNYVGNCYGYNINGVDNNWGVPNAGNAIRNVAVTRPAKTLAFADALDWIIKPEGSDAYNGKEERVVSKMTAYRHNNGANIVFFDGHAEFRTRDTVAVPKDDATKNKDLWTILE